LKFRKKSAMMMFVAGPATDIRPLFLLVIRPPDMMTAPGAAKTIPVKDSINARISMWLFALNSAKQPNRCATIL